MTKTERSLLDKAALAAFGALMARNSAMLIKDRAAIAWQAADEFIKARKESDISRYDRILDEYQGTEALRRILELDSNAGRYLNFITSRYAVRPEPLRAYAEDNIGHGKTAGQIAIMRFLRKQAKEDRLF